MLNRNFVVILTLADSRHDSLTDSFIVFGKVEQHEPIEDIEGNRFKSTAVAQ